MHYQHKLINKAIRHYRYDEQVDVKKAMEEFFEGYAFNYNDYRKNKYDFSNFISTIGAEPEGTHIAAKNMLWQGNSECWKYFERTALFWSAAQNNDERADHLKDAYYYALYVERNDLLEMLIRKTIGYIEQHKTDKDFQQQPVYPGTCLIHFLVEKWLGSNPALNLVLQYGNGYGIYRPLIDNWNDYTKIGKEYWDELCEYHLGQLSLVKPDQRDHEELIAFGLVPMELIDLFKVRKKLGLDVPEITHELFKTPMAAYPQIPTGYNEHFDIVYQTAKRTSETGARYTYEEMVNYIRETYGAADDDLIL